MAPNNQAARMLDKNGRPFKVRKGHTRPSAPARLSSRTRRWPEPFRLAPFILGTDVAGQVVEVGPDVTRFRVGDRVCGSTTALARIVNNPTEGGFQLYTVGHVRAHVGPNPIHVTDEQDMPKIPAPTEVLGKSGKPRVVIITGGASSVGSNAIQLAVCASYQYVKGLGATHVFDYNSTALVEDLLRVVKGHELARAYTIRQGAVEASTTVMHRHNDSLTRKRIALASGTNNGDRLMTFELAGVEVKFIIVDGPIDPNSVVAHLYKEFLPHALEQCQFVPAPSPQVVGKELEKIQDAIETQRKGVSGRKIVVTLERDREFRMTIGTDSRAATDTIPTTEVLIPAV
ncbi:hypothetical protein BJX63DRAFT_425123 [Aspergillus granulosus]|uniref:Alcohol dehydrogenase-like N-terminal domain-containing protein n=1 Tax=Aspergillus granulosus TaxID=176169 RepID=A0ABR4GX20_9EURO